MSLKQKLHLQKLNANQKGSDNRNWRGGISETTYGYVYARCPGHPRATKQGHYVMEHILTMEKHLGRYLAQGEEIHHKNGIKNDNRIENLELTETSEHRSFHMKEKHINNKIPQVRDNLGRFTK